MLGLESTRLTVVLQLVLFSRNGAQHLGPVIQSNFCAVGYLCAFVHFIPVGWVNIVKSFLYKAPASQTCEERRLVPGPPLGPSPLLTDLGQDLGPCLLTVIVNNFTASPASEAIWSYDLSLS